MGARREIDGSAGVAAFYGKELRHKREGAGLTLEQLAEGSFYGFAYISEIEHGRRTIPRDLAAHADRELDTDGFFARNREDVRKARLGDYAHYFADLVTLEKKARGIEEWSPTLVPGPLQLEPYIRAVVHASHPSDTEESVAGKVSDRRERAWVFEDREGPASWAVLHEGLLTDPIMGFGDMAEQLAHIAAVGRTRAFLPQILPRNAGAHPFMMGTTWLMTFDDAPPLMYTEGMYTGQLVDDPATVAQYNQAYNRLRAAALPPETSLRLIEAAAEDYRNGKQPQPIDLSLLA
ncbi:helix-turn-helix transcriptional regulator [Streptomyces sp. NPDC046887]|uniref:helix-turn-helix domain-containing protein n=1 Tax=Streptomyces sp. NPDC046887 TaxID=3155472 RepID=UPI0033D028B7